jgi:site-specific recombinase XerD
MLDDYEQYEKACEEIRQSNALLLEEFGQWLQQSNLKPNTIKKHTQNIDFYINEFLLYDDATTPEQGIDEVSMFLGYWFIKKAMWASAASIKSNAASLKKFYKFLHEKGLVSKENLGMLKSIIKEEMPDWLATLNRYDDPSIDNMMDVWGL